MQEMISSAGFLTMVAVVATLGTASLAAQQIGFTALSLTFMPGFAFGMASTALVGQSIGAGRPEDAERAGRIAVTWSMIWMAIGGGVCFIFAGPLMGIFTDDPEVVSAGVNALRALAVGLPAWSVWFVFGGALRGIGDTRSPMITSAFAVWGAVGIAYLAVTYLDGGLGMVWLSFLVTAPLAALANWYVFRRRMASGVRAQIPAVSVHTA
jgi:Na+-driven multidrug efflux pump